MDFRLINNVKSIIKYLLRSVGVELRRAHNSHPGSEHRPIGFFEAFLEDIAARGFKPRFVLDVGANRGKWTRMAKRVFPRATYLLIEPQPEMRPYLDSLCSEFRDIYWVEAGAGANKGKLIQTIWDDFEGSSFLPKVNEEMLRSGRQREVEIITIDSLLESRGGQAPELVKLDIQGFELEALKGANSLFGTTELFILEVSLFCFIEGTPLLREVVTFMGDRGYEIYDIPGYLRRPFDGALGQVDLAFAKNGGILRHSHGWLK
jgi:FkbM family methyltransferase